MKRTILIIMVLATLVVTANAQSLSVANLEAQEGEQTELVISLAQGTAMTALQFNLSLPEGVTLADGEATLGSAANGHTLSVQTLNSGDLLFILYSMDLKPFKDGELLRIPVTAGSTETTSNGKLYTVRTATADAVSHTCEDATFSAIVSGAYKLGDGNGDGVVDISDFIGVANHILGNTPAGFNVDAADVNKDGVIDISDYIGVANIILTGSPTGK